MRGLFVITFVVCAIYGCSPKNPDIVPTQTLFYN